MDARDKPKQSNPVGPTDELKINIPNQNTELNSTAKFLSTAFQFQPADIASDMKLKFGTYDKNKDFTITNLNTVIERDSWGAGPYPYDVLSINISQRLHQKLKEHLDHTEYKETDIPWLYNWYDSFNQKMQPHFETDANMSVEAKKQLSFLKSSSDKAQKKLLKLKKNFNNFEIEMRTSLNKTLNPTEHATYQKILTQFDKTFNQFDQPFEQFNALHPSMERGIHTNVYMALSVIAVYYFAQQAQIKQLQVLSQLLVERFPAKLTLIKLKNAARTLHNDVVLLVEEFLEKVKEIMFKRYYGKYFEFSCMSNELIPLLKRVDKTYMANVDLQNFYNECVKYIKKDIQAEKRLWNQKLFDTKLLTNCSMIDENIFSDFINAMLEEELGRMEESLASQEIYDSSVIVSCLHDQLMIIAIEIAHTIRCLRFAVDAICSEYSKHQAKIANNPSNDTTKNFTITLDKKPSASLSHEEVRAKEKRQLKFLEQIKRQKREEEARKNAELLKQAEALRMQKQREEKQVEDIKLSILDKITVLSNDKQRTLLRILSGEEKEMSEDQVESLGNDLGLNVKSTKKGGLFGIADTLTSYHRPHPAEDSGDSVNINAIKFIGVLLTKYGIQQSDIDNIMSQSTKQKNSIL